MRTLNAAHWSAIEQDGLESRLLIVADGSVLVRIQERPTATHERVARHAPAVLCGLALLLACLSAGALGTTYFIHRDTAERLTMQANHWQDTLDTALRDVRLHADERIGAVLVRTDDLGQKVEQISQHVDVASRDVLATMSGSLSTVRTTLENLGPQSFLSFASSPGATASPRFERSEGAASLREAQTFKPGAGLARPVPRPKQRTSHLPPSLHSASVSGASDGSATTAIGSNPE